MYTRRPFFVNHRPLPPPLDPPPAPPDVHYDPVPLAPAPPIDSPGPPAGGSAPAALPAAEKAPRVSAVLWERGLLVFGAVDASGGRCTCKRLSMLYG